jgi:hypothetical protein
MKTEQRGIVSGINRSKLINCLVGKFPFRALYGHHHERSINFLKHLHDIFTPRPPSVFIRQYCTFKCDKFDVDLRKKECFSSIMFYSSFPM